MEVISSQIETYLQYIRNCNESQALDKNNWLIGKVFKSHGNVQRGRPTTYNSALLDYFWTMKLLDYHHEYITNYVKSKFQRECKASIIYFSINALMGALTRDYRAFDARDTLWFSSASSLLAIQ